MSFKPSLRDVLPAESQDGARAALAARPDLSAGTPWYVNALTGFGAWLASLFLMFFLALTVLVSKEVGAIVLGLILTTGALFLRRMGHNVFLTQFALALGLAGQGLFIGGVGALSEGKTPPVLAALVIQTVLLFIHPDLVQRFLSALFASAALLLLIRLIAPGVLVDVTLVGLALLIHLLFLFEARLQSGWMGERVAPAAFGFVTTFLWELLERTWFQRLYSDFLDHDTERLPAGVLTMGLAAVTLYSAWRVLEEAGARPSGPAGVTTFATLGLTSLLTLQTPGIIAACGLLMLGFHRRSVLLLGMAVVFLLTFGQSYYYSLELTLLAKSLTLLGSGLVLLGLRLFILRRFLAAEEVR